MYVGVTSDLVGRVWQHRNGLLEGFTKRYGVKMLVWYEAHETMEGAIKEGEGAEGVEAGVEVEVDRGGES